MNLSSTGMAEQVLLPSVSYMIIRGIQRVCQGLSVLIKGLNIEFQGTEEEKITVSCGYTDVVECECDEFEKLLDMAGEALQQARKDGGNCSVGYLQVKALKEN